MRESAHCCGAMPPVLVDGRDRHRRVVEEAHEAHFGGALRVAAVVARAIEHQRARGARARRRRRRRPCGTAAPAPACRRASCRSRSSTSVFTSPGAPASVVSSAAPSPATMSASLSAAGADLREIVVEPARQRGVEIDDVARAHRPRRSRPARGRDSRSRAAVPGRRSPAARARA